MNVVDRENLLTWLRDAKSARERKLRENRRHFTSRLIRVHLMVSSRLSVVRVTASQILSLAMSLL